MEDRTLRSMQYDEQRDKRLKKRNEESLRDPWDSVKKRPIISSMRVLEEQEKEGRPAKVSNKLEQKISKIYQKHKPTELRRIFKI